MSNITDNRYEAKKYNCERVEKYIRSTSDCPERNISYNMQETVKPIKRLTQYNLGGEEEKEGEEEEGEEEEEEEEEEEKKKKKKKSTTTASLWLPGYTISIGKKHSFNSIP
ncbi:Hypothetical predicted protein [Octopus vulgaris]|uniref:Uncharacterized protein n=1 Tax=Octopus vulgaris TaxID=6645 RepID=A0AA36F409_OCTVU|nr:Hypothetical predicted protein [Octopus vulgaris]